jgi:hypothetical protein
MERRTNRYSIPTTLATVLPRAQLKELPKSDAKKLPVKLKLESKSTVKCKIVKPKNRRKLNSVTSTLPQEKLTLLRT